ncbi:MAG: helix-turn-helix domain-containing protein [Candidatus Poribacteria bacterium]|nr:helix-turn-helix domain-containing protein [Candidatus Poribacteria bacterium]
MSKILDRSMLEQMLFLFRLGLNLKQVSRVVGIGYRTLKGWVSDANPAGLVFELQQRSGRKRGGEFAFVDMGVEPFIFSSATRGSFDETIKERVVRVTPALCTEIESVDALAVDLFGESDKVLRSDITVKKYPPDGAIALRLMLSLASSDDDSEGYDDIHSLRLVGVYWDGKGGAFLASTSHLEHTYTDAGGKKCSLYDVPDAGRVYYYRARSHVPDDFFLDRHRTKEALEMTWFTRGVYKSGSGESVSSGDTSDIDVMGMLEEAASATSLGDGAEETFKIVLISQNREKYKLPRSVLLKCERSKKRLRPDVNLALRLSKFQGSIRNGGEEQSDKRDSRALTKMVRESDWQFVYQKHPHLPPV